jgi:hypothetical protein
MSTFRISAWKPNRRPQSRDRETPVAVGHDDAPCAGPDLRHGDGGARQRGLGSVDYRANDAGRGGLLGGSDGAGRQHEHESEVDEPVQHKNFEIRNSFGTWNLIEGGVALREPTQRTPRAQRLSPVMVFFCVHCVLCVPPRRVAGSHAKAGSA